MSREYGFSQPGEAEERYYTAAARRMLDERQMTADPKEWGVVAARCDAFLWLVNHDDFTTELAERILQLDGIRLALEVIGRTLPVPLAREDQSVPVIQAEPKLVSPLELVAQLATHPTCSQQLVEALAKASTSSLRQVMGVLKAAFLEGQLELAQPGDRLFLYKDPVDTALEREMARDLKSRLETADPAQVGDLWHRMVILGRAVTVDRRFVDDLLEVILADEKGFDRIFQAAYRTLLPDLDMAASSVAPRIWSLGEEPRLQYFVELMLGLAAHPAFSDELVQVLADGSNDMRFLDALEREFSADGGDQDQDQDTAAR